METLAITFVDCAKAKSSHELCLCWNNVQIGKFEITDHTMTWHGYADPKYATLFNQRETDGMPYFLVNLHPENELYELLDEDDQASYIQNGLRFLSNLTISKNCPYDHPVKKDTLLAHMDAYITDATFKGTYDGPTLEELGDRPANILKEYWKNRYVPRFSGKEIKIPATLNSVGNVEPAISTPFTHMIKLPTAGAKEAWGFNEWMCLELSEAAGLRTAKHALFPMGESSAPALLIERFDIPDQHDDGDKWFVIQDFCTLVGLDPKDRGSGSLEQVAKIIRQHSTDAKTDLEDLYKRAVLSVAINDGDMHRKNLSMLFEYSPSEARYTKVCMTPSYDITSEIWEYDQDHKQTLSIQGKHAGFKDKTLVAFGKMLGLTEDRAYEILKDTLTRVAERAVDIAGHLPEAAARHESCRFAAQRIATIAVKNACRFGAAAPEWTDVDAPKTSVKMVNGEKHLRFLPS